MHNLLYYPYINLPKTDWTIRTLLYYDKIGSIVPQQYFYAPENYDPYMREMIDNALVDPINPMDVLDNPGEIFEPFIHYLETQRERILKRCTPVSYCTRTTYIHHDKFNYPKSRIHADKFDTRVFHQLEQMGLAVREDYEWYRVEKKIASELMTFLVNVIGSKLNYQPITDQFRAGSSFHYHAEDNFKIYQTRKKREVILTELIPFPENINITDLKRFKEKHHDLLEAFRNKIELIVLNPVTDIDTSFLLESIRELRIRKEELTAKMNENHFGNIFFGTICGITGAIIGLATTGGWGTFMGLPGFANAIYSALKTEKAEKTFDQSGMKYLALMDKRLRKEKTILQHQ